MPGLNKRGQEGEGPMTGRKQGRCTNFGNDRTINNENVNQLTTEVDDLNNERGFGRKQRRCQGKGQGRGLGNRNRFRGGE